MYFRDFAEFRLIVTAARAGIKNIETLSVVLPLHRSSRAHKVFFKADGEPL
jgi:hypothetical protein